MTNIRSALWVEFRKAYRSGMIAISFGIISLMPLVDALFMIIMKNPERARELGMIGAKAELMAGIADWPTFYYVLVITVGAMGAILFAFLTAWVFGREYADRTVKELLALPTPRTAIVAAKLILLAVWTQALMLWNFIFGVAIGRLVDIPGGSSALDSRIFGFVLVVSFLSYLLVPCVAFAASAGRGYMPPMAFAITTLILTQLASVLGWSDWFPWATPLMIAETLGPKGGTVAPHSVWIVFLTFAIGTLATVMWWRGADQAK